MVGKAPMDRKQAEQLMEEHQQVPAHLPVARLDLMAESLLEVKLMGKQR